MYTHEDYEPVPGNHQVHVVLFQAIPGSSEYFVRLWVDEENWSGPIYERDKGHESEVEF